MNAVPELFLKHKSFQPISHPPEGQNIPVAADLHGAIGNTTRNCSGLSLNVAIFAALSGFLEEKGISSFLVAHLFFFPGSGMPFLLSFTLLLARWAALHRGANCQQLKTPACVL